ncbi:MAG: ABC transporter ATP-binding protein [Bacteroidetes bacterium]|nr:ABC transporter ATP-binding protein [Bacteroidota bacterium]
MSEVAIIVNELSKIYKLYKNNHHRLKEAFHPLKKSYHEDFYALKDISFNILAGTTTGFIGQNGSGKSTLLKVLTGIIQPSSGTIHVNGKVSALLELGTGFNPELTGLENVFFNGTILGFTKKEIQEKLESIIDFAEIGDFIHQPVKLYSSGMFVRLAFSTAINVDPDILIVDEALAVGDSYFQVKCMNRMKQFKDEGKTILFVSHDPGAVKTLCDKTYLLEEGKIIDSGAPDKVFDYYNSLISLKKRDRLSLDKDKLRKRTGNRKIEIIDVKIRNKDDIATDTFVSGEAVKIVIQAKANERIENPTFGFSIRDRLGTDVFGINNFLLEKEFGVFKKDHIYTVTYSLDLNIGTNIYSLSVSAHTLSTHIQENFDWINDYKIFKVIPNHDFSFIGFSKLYSSVLVEDTSIK